MILRYVATYFIFCLFASFVIASCAPPGGEGSSDDATPGGETVNLDRDGDGLSNIEEDRNSNGIVDVGETDPDDDDTDNDGKNDYDELSVDTDGDGFSDAVESAFFDEDSDGVNDEMDPDSTPGVCTGKRILSDGRYTETFTLATTCSPYLVTGNIIISDASIDIEAGVEIRFRRKGSLQIGDSSGPGELLIAGSAGNLVSLVSDEYEPGQGDWSGVRVTNGGAISLQYAKISGAGLSSDNSVSVGLLVEKATDIRIRNSEFSDNGGYGLYVNIDESNSPPENLFSAFSENSFSDNDYSMGINLRRLPEISLSSSSFSFGPIELLGNELRSSLTLENRGVPYFFEEDCRIVGPTNQVDPPTDFRVNAGVTMRFASGKGLIVGYGNTVATLTISGTSGEPVIIGSRPDSQGAWGGIEFLSGANTIGDAWLLNTGAFKAESGMNSVFIIRNDAWLNFGETSSSVVDSIGSVKYQEATDCSLVPPGLPSSINVIGYQECQVYCKNVTSGEGVCKQP